MPNKHSLTLSVDHDVWKRFKELSDDLRLTPSKEIEFLMRIWIREKEKIVHRKGGNGWVKLVLASMVGCSWVVSVWL